MSYLLDANVFIKAKDTYYGFDTAPGFWEWLRDEHSRGTVCSISAVRDELLVQDDELAEWAKSLPPSFWLHEDDAVVPHLQRVAAWAMAPELAYFDTARAEFLAVADYRLVAAALAWKMDVSTNEQSHPARKKRIMLPDACEAHSVPVVEGHRLFRELGLRLVQETARGSERDGLPLD